MSRYFKLLFESEKSLQDEYSKKNSKIFKVLQNTEVQKKYNKIVNFYSFAVFQGISLLWIYKRNPFIIKNISNIIRLLGKYLLMTTININIFINKADIVKFYLNEKEGRVTKKFGKFRFLTNPLFLLQKDKLILKIISFFNFKRNGQSLNIKSTKLKKEPTNLNKIKEGFL